MFFFWETSLAVRAVAYSKVGNAEMEQWQVRRLALESLFFAPI